MAVMVGAIIVGYSASDAFFGGGTLANRPVAVRVIAIGVDEGVEEEIAGVAFIESDSDISEAAKDERITDSMAQFLDPMSPENARSDSQLFIGDFIEPLRPDGEALDVESATQSIGKFQDPLARVDESPPEARRLGPVSYPLQ